MSNAVASPGDGLVYTEDGWANIGPFVGQPGPPGENGADGAPGPPGADGEDGADGVDGVDGVGVPVGGTTGQVLAKNSDDDYDTEWVTGGGGGGITTEDAVDAVAAALVEGSGIDIVYDDTANTITVTATGGGGITAEDAVDAVATALTEGTGIDLAYDDPAGTITVTVDKTELSLSKSDVGLGNVDNTSDADKPVSTAQAAADALKADKTTTISTTAPLAGGGDLSANRTLTVAAFTDTTPGVVPLSGGGTVNFLRADGTWTPSVAGGGALYQFIFSSTTTTPPTGSQIRFNNTTMTSVTAVNVMYQTSDSIDVKQRLLNSAVPGVRLYVQDKDNSSQYQIFTVAGTPTDNTTWASIPVTFVSGGTALTSGQAALAGFIYNPITATETQSGVVELATTAEATAQSDTQRAVTPAGLADRVKTTRTLTTTAPLTIGGGASADLSADRTLAVSAASDTAAGVVELATSAETLTGTDTTRAVTPAGGFATFAPKAVVINAQTGTTYTLVLTDASKLVTLSNASAITLTVPTNASVAFPTGTTVDLAQIGAGQVTVAGAGGVTVNATPGLKCRAQYSGATLVKTGTDAWLLFGDLSA